MLVYLAQLYEIMKKTLFRIILVLTLSVILSCSKTEKNRRPLPKDIVQKFKLSAESIGKAFAMWGDKNHWIILVDGKAIVGVGLNASGYSPVVSEEPKEHLIKMLITSQCEYESFMKLLNSLNIDISKKQFAKKFKCIGDITYKRPPFSKI